MSVYGLPVLFAIVIWWFSTGVIFFLDTRPAWTFRYSFAAVTVLSAGAVWGIIVTSGQTTVAGAYAGFTYGLIAWGWLETAFYMGFMVGPRRAAPAMRARGWAHFRQAIGTTLYHELGAVALAALIGAICWDMPNKLALWTFLALWLMQLSAKLNVFLGVANLAEEFLPQHLAFLRHYMTRRPMNAFFPVSIGFGLLATTLLVSAAASTNDPFEIAAYTMLAALLGLAVLEHILLVVPFTLSVLWTWSIKGAAQAPRRTPAAKDKGDLSARSQESEMGTASTSRLSVSHAETALLNPVVP